MKPFRVIDSHTGGEPTRVIVDGGPDLGSGSIADRRELLRSQFDAYRRCLCNEPRGSDVMVGAMLTPPVDSKNAAGVIFFNNVGYLNMCGHGTIGVIETLRHLGRISYGEHGIETPVGVVRGTLHDDRRVSIINRPAFRFRKDVAVDVPAVGRVIGDIAWGGNWFFLVTDHGQVIERSNIDSLLDFTRRLMHELDRQNIRGEDGGVIDHIELFGPPSSKAVADSRNFVLCPGGAYDRSPCGTGTSAKLACLAADGMLAPGQLWRQESIVGSIFEGRYVPADRGIVPTITGRAFVNADLQIIIDPEDPFSINIPTS